MGELRETHADCVRAGSPDNVISNLENYYTNTSVKSYFVAMQLIDLSTNTCTSINDFPKGKGFKIANLNIRRLRNNVEDLQFYLKQNPYEILTHETWLSEKNCNSLLLIDGYHFERLDRDEKGGGVGCFIQKNISYIRRPDLEDSELELCGYR